MVPSVDCPKPGDIPRIRTTNVATMQPPPNPPSCSAGDHGVSRSSTRSVLPVARDVDPAAAGHHALHGADLGDVAGGIAREHYEIGELAGLQRTQVALAIQEPGGRSR